MTKSNSNIIFSDDPPKRKPDITGANDILKWQPKINFNTGINLTINYFKSIQN
jgi:nucleoside-diphosphate-sugar epimerase